MPFLGGATVTDLLDHLYPHPAARPPARARAILDAVAAAGRPGDPEPDLRLSGPDLAGLSFADGVARLGASLAEALAFLHGRGLAHCDLKPSNVLLTPSARPLLLDFNLSQREDRPLNWVGGTFLYMAPEQIRAHYDKSAFTALQAARADLFSLGVVLYQLLTGKHPFGRPPRDTHPTELGRWLLGRLPEGVVPLERLNPDVPGPLAEVVRRCLEPDPRKRPSGAAEVARLLRPRPRGPRRWATLAAAALAALLLGVSASVVPARSPEPDPEGTLDGARAAGLRALEEACQLRAAGLPTVAVPKLRTAAARFRKVLDLHQTLGGPPERGWQDNFAQGRAMMLLGAAAHAGPYFTEAVALWKRNPEAGAPSPLPAIRACQAYCYLHLGRHDYAQHLAQEALEAGYRPAGLLNNLGYSAFQTRKIDLARRYFDEALRKSPDLYQALYNRSYLAYRQTIRRPGKPIPAWVLADLDRAIHAMGRSGEPESAEPYRVAAQIHAQASVDLLRAGGPVDQAELARRKGRALGYLLRAYVLGMDPGPLLNDPVFTRALGDWRMHLAGLHRQGASVVVRHNLCDPLAGALR
jgi:tetratricopeptide (TPR) repeat protein